jgi:hypothetical protein
MEGEMDSGQRGTEDLIKPVCGLLPMAPRVLESPIDPRRARLIRNAEKKWVNGTALHFCFLEGPGLSGAEKQKQAVRDAFSTWKELGIGLNFQEVDSSSEAEVRIGFDPNGGSWAYVGRDAVDYAPDPFERTVNYGWDLTTPYGRDTALHEIGHVLGFPHEHQNPNAGIQWDEQAVYAYFAGAPNRWDQQTTYHNIIRKLDPGEVQGSHWDQDSIMHYEFAPGLIRHPEQFRARALRPAAGLSSVDIEEVRRFYPPLEPQLPELNPWQLERVTVQPGAQLNWCIHPDASRSYTMQTFGDIDSVMVLFEVIDGEPRYVDGDDDSGWSRNARITARLIRGREYILRLRLYSANAGGGGALLMY